jgi:CBS domain-containing protein
MKIESCMKRNVVYISTDTKIVEAAAIMVKKHVGILPVVDEDGCLVGVIDVRDMMSLELPDFLNLIEDVDFVHDFGAVETTRPDAKSISREVTAIMRPAEPIDVNCGLLRAFALMDKDGVMDLPVVDGDGKLVGVVSRVDIGTAVLSLWPGGKA